MIDLNISQIRREYFPVTEKCIYMNTANHGPPSIPVQESVRRFLLDWDKLSRNGDKRTTEACDNFAKLVNASRDEICAQPNTSAGLATVAESLSYRAGMNVVINDLENAANVYPWLAQQRKGVEIRVIRGVEGEIKIEDLERSIDDNTIVVSISHVQWLTGARSDLKTIAEIAHDHGAYLVIDGIQAAGGLNVDLKKEDVDFYAAGSYKWLLGPSGAGFLYVRDELIESLIPPVYGYRGAYGGFEPKLKNTAKRLEFGEPSYLSFVGTDAAMKMFLKIGASEIETQVLKLSGLLYDGLNNLGVNIVSPGGYDKRSGVLSFTTGDMDKLMKSLVAAGFVLSMRSLGVRVSVNFFNTEEEIAKLLDCIKQHK